MPHGPQIAAERLFADRDAMPLMHQLHQVTQPPTHHAMDRRDRAIVDRLQQLMSLHRVEPRCLPGRLAVQQPSRTVCVEPQNPITEGLQLNPAGFRSIASRAAIVDHRQCHQPPRLIGIIRLLRRLP